MYDPKKKKKVYRKLKKIYLFGNFCKKGGGRFGVRGSRKPEEKDAPRGVSFFRFAAQRA